jgi:hypothetical protein
VHAELTATYPTGIRIPDKQMTALEATGILTRQKFHGEWNYTIHPGTAQPTRSQHSDTPETNWINSSRALSHVP